jgi:hypothetical protein
MILSTHTLALGLKTMNLSIKDRMVLAYWLRAGVSLSEIDSTSRIGIVENERYSSRTVDVYRIMWEWSAPRYSSRAQERYYNRCGMDALNRRIQRCQKIVFRFLHNN